MTNGDDFGGFGPVHLYLALWTRIEENVLQAQDAGLSEIGAVSAACLALSGVAENSEEPWAPEAKKVFASIHNALVKLEHGQGQSCIDSCQGVLCPGCAGEEIEK